MYVDSLNLRRTVQKSPQLTPKIALSVVLTRTARNWRQQSLSLLY